MKKFKINGDTMTTVVVFSLLFSAAVAVTGIVLGTYGVDVSAIVDSTLRVFGTELGICGVMTIFKRWTEQQDRRTEERRQRRERRGLNERNTENNSTKSADG